MTPIDLTPPEIDYLAKDYASFRRLMLDHLSQLVPDWKDQNPADLGYALVEALAYAADYLSYYQDAVATEAYLSTARLRRSIRRHVRLLEYYLQEGCNARTWVQVQVKGKLFLPVQTQLLVSHPALEKPVVRSEEAVYRQALEDGAPVFETMHPIYLLPDHNSFPVRPANEKEYILPKGSTSAYLHNWRQIATSDLPRAGSVLILREQPAVYTGTAHPEHCHAVRLTRVTSKKSADGTMPQLPPDPAASYPWIEIEWVGADALPFDLCIGPYEVDHPESSPAVALGNVVLADHGRTIYNEELPVVRPDERYRPHLRFLDLTFATPFDWRVARKQSASQAMYFQPYEAYGCVHLKQYAAFVATRKKGSHVPMLLEDVPANTLNERRGEKSGKSILTAMQYTWTLRRDLLNSGPFDRDFQVEMEEDRRTYLRFGFGGAGKLPDPGETFVATYRVGNGSKGNVGAGTITHIVDDSYRWGQGELEASLLEVCNPLPARGGVDPEDIETARLHAPYAYREQKACVTQDDYVRRACQHFGVLHAAAHIRWDGSRRKVVISVQRTGGKPVDDAFQKELLEFIEPFRVMGHEVLIEDPRYVPVRITLQVFLQSRAAAASVREALSTAFSQQICPDGQMGFFYPDRFDFGQSLYQSQVIARAMVVPGVRDIQVKQFRRVHNGRDEDEIHIEPGEIARLDRIDFIVEGRL